jgi:hypothetical protein
MSDFDEKQESQTKLSTAEDATTWLEIGQLAKNVAKEVFVNTSCHAVPNILRTHRWGLKLIWLLVFIAGNVLALYFCFLSSKSYFNYDVTISVESIEESPTYFPVHNSIVKFLH